MISNFNNKKKLNPSTKNSNPPTKNLLKEDCQSYPLTMRTRPSNNASVTSNALPLRWRINILPTYGICKMSNVKLYLTGTTRLEH